MTSEFCIYNLFIKSHFQKRSPLVSRKRYVGKMKAKKKIHRIRNIPDRADGYIFFSLRWGEKTFSHRSRHSIKLDNTIRILKERMKQIPTNELQMASVKMEATVRKKEGNLKRITLAKWDGTKPIEEFIKIAKKKWNELPKEVDNQGDVIELDLPDNSFGHNS
jgi:hypothetical protein